MSTKPKRIQMSRKKGSVKPEGAIYVGRPTRWGNPFKVGDLLQGSLLLISAPLAVDLFEVYLRHRPILQRAVVAELAGHDLACWCPLDAPCHADILLGLANG